MKINSRFKADLTLLFVTVLWGSAFAVLRVALSSHVVFYLNGFRLLLGASILYPLARWQKEKPDRQLIFPVFVTGLALFAAVVLQMIGLEQTTAGNAGFITSLYVIVVPFILWIGWREKPSPFFVLAVGMAVTGGYLLSTAGTFHIVTGDLWVLGSSFFWAIHVVLVGHFASRVPPLSYASGQFFVAGLLNLVIGGLFEHPTLHAIQAILPGVVYTGIFSIATGFTLQVMAQKHTPSADAALILSLESVFAAFFGWLVVGEKLLPVQLVGCTLILTAVVLAQARELHIRLNREIKP